MTINFFELVGTSFMILFIGMAIGVLINWKENNWHAIDKEGMPKKAKEYIVRSNKHGLDYYITTDTIWLDMEGNPNWQNRMVFGEHYTHWRPLPLYRGRKRK